jgi:hypothetical protein
MVMMPPPNVGPLLGTMDITFGTVKNLKRTPTSKSTPLLLTDTVTVPAPLVGNAQIAVEVEIYLATDACTSPTWQRRSLVSSKLRPTTVTT